MKTAIFDYDDYKNLMNALIESKPQNGRGQRKLLAEAVHCQVAYITHVLSGDNHFSLEQAEAAGRFFNLTKEELEYLLVLVQYNRAGTPTLKRIFHSQLEERRKRNRLLKHRLKIKETLSAEDQAIYYSSWHFAAIHILLTLPDFDTTETIARKFSLSSERVLEVLEFLLRLGFVKKEQNRYIVASAMLHLESDSALISKHHVNWRIKTLQTLEHIDEDSLHYSLVFSISKRDLSKVRETLVEALENCADIIRPSKEEEVAALCVDLFYL